MQRNLALGTAATVVVGGLLVTNPLVAQAAAKITGADIVNNSISSADVKNGSLRSKDFKAGELTAGPVGPAGPAGPTGAAGQAGERGPAGPGFVPRDDRFAVLYPIASGIARLAVRGDGSVRVASEPNATVIRPRVGLYCINAPGALEGAVGSLQTEASAGGGTIRVTMGITTPCDSAVPGSEITVETFGV